MIVYRYHRGTLPLLISVPHCGTYLPDDIARTMSPAAASVTDTDWHVERMYEFARELGAHLLIATHSRYVIDLNRAPDGTVLYPGNSNTELVPLSTFNDEDLYLPGKAPDRAEVERRRSLYWQPYHDMIAKVLTRMTEEHGKGVLWDAHSIAARVPRFFEGEIPDLNLGTADGASADAGLSERVMAAAAAAEGFTSVLNGRFKGGYITRHYGNPAAGIHAIQLEMSWRAYLDPRPPFPWEPARAQAVIDQALKPMIGAVTAWLA